ncbi:o-succinylbenzoate synthase [Nakamurella aerolata]|uniref:o-succinylbenzoate synthase n=1 Tax=Nakamurella aerolata TaxID=1656892 RepID=A0A849A4R5_9ACTN|nr:o-succinylbenzoate synthase [Nakamurella aerolata]NNG35057.1 o-succinylbenzoate synthase [Nakamurella aerolata]
MKPTTADILSTAAVFAVPLRDRFRGVTRRDGVLLRGPAGWSEFAPFDNYTDAQCVTWLQAALDSAVRPWPDPVRAVVAVNATVPAVGPQRAQQIVRAAGCHTVKVKVAGAGTTPDADVERVAAVREALGPVGNIRVDANAMWTVPEALRELPRLRAAAGDLEYVEQPCASIDELAEVQRRQPVPVAADESIRLAADPLQVARRRAASVAVLKVPPLGGVGATLDIARQIRDEAGMAVVISSAVDTSVGLAAGIAAAAALPELPYACGLGTGAMLTADVTAEPLVARGGELTPGRVRVDPALLQHVQADRATTAHWLQRLHRVAALLP